MIHYLVICNGNNSSVIGKYCRILGIFIFIFKGNPNLQGILLYHCSKEHKNIENLQFIEENTAISFCPSLCFLQFVLPWPFSKAYFFQFLYTVLWEISNVTSDHLCCCIKNCVYNNFSLHYFVSSIMESLSQPSKLATANGNCRSQFKIYFQMLFYSF